MPDTPAISRARESGDPQDWAMAWRETVETNPILFDKSAEDLVGWMTGWFANAGQAMIDSYVKRHLYPNHLPSDDLQKAEGAFDGAETVEEVVYQAIGAGSVCWESMEGTGIFNDGWAGMLGASAVKRLQELGVQVTPSGRPQLAGQWVEGE